MGSLHALNRLDSRDPYLFEDPSAVVPRIDEREPTRVFELETVSGGAEGKETTVWLDSTNQPFEEFPMFGRYVSLES